jgi:hypothetical protein
MSNLEENMENQGQLGTAGVELSKTSAVVKKALSYRYLTRYILPNLGRGSARELAFPLSRLGRLLFKEGYSAEMMKAIYLQDSQPYGLFDRIFLGYPLHRAIYHRLQILTRLIETELRQRLERLVEGDIITIMTAPSGYALDLFQPLERIARSNAREVEAIYMLASDLDPAGRIQGELLQAARRVGIGFEFVRGDLALASVRRQLQCTAPYDIVVFVGFSTWMPRPHLVSHLRLIREDLLAPGGVLFTDCFTPGAFALSGKYLGYKANYYQPREFTSILAYCGFAPGDVSWESGPEGISHVCAARMESGN